MSTLLDTDLYKLTMMQAVWLKQPDAMARYAFINRRPENRFTAACVKLIRERVRELCDAKLTAAELEYLATLKLFRPAFLDYLGGVQLREYDVDIRLDDGQLRIGIVGPWVRTILWEVPLMTIISETYFETVDRNWDNDLEAYRERAVEKGQRLTAAGCAFVEFGTRRRRSYAAQEAVIRAFNQPGVACAGTSNVHFAMKYGMRPIGTMAHEWIMGYAGLVGVAQANVAALTAWCEVYGDQLDTALTDTYTTDLFLENIRGDLARKYGALRHDSECPFAFLEKALRFYEGEGIDPQAKRIVFSDSLNVDLAIRIQQRAAGRIGAAFGIGTHFTNDFPGSRALNMVIKLFAINDCEVAKISDNPAKACGAPKAVNDALKAIAEALAPA